MFTITYVLNGGTLSGKTGTVTFEYEEGTVITLPMPTRDDYAFDYWEGSKYDAGASYTVTGDHTFTAQWKTAEISPETGESRNIILWIGFICLGGMMASAMLAFKKKRA